MAQNHKTPPEKPNTRTIPGAPGKPHAPSDGHPAKPVAASPAKK
jgi:hypothetical protein